MADTTISITIAEAQFTILQNAIAHHDENLEASDVTANKVKEMLVGRLKNEVSQYDREVNKTINYSTFSPS